jgi:16S rRNA (adenine1518-N6/adenine1519-N6)-dimethyltransferase
MTKQVSQLSHQRDFRPSASTAGRAFKPLKRLGQHFLRQKSVLTKIIEAASLRKSDLVVEIGPGLGVLTKELAAKAGQVIAIEKDSRLIPLLKEKFAKTSNVKIIEGDARRLLDARRLPLATRRYKVVANLPYYAATHIIRQFLESPCPPKLMVVMLQKEVAQRICSQPPHMNLLAVAIRFYAKAEIIVSVPKTAFWPAPKVDSAIIKLKTQSAKRKIDEKLFFKIIKAGFSQPRKTLLNNLSAKLVFPKSEVEKKLTAVGINPKARPSELSLKHWLFLSKALVI